MGIRSDPAGALYKVVRISGIAALQYQFDTAEHLPGTPGIDHFAAFDLHLDTQVAFDPCNRINYDTLCHELPPSSLGYSIFC
jgi:hypothetical protein